MTKKFLFTLLSASVLVTACGPSAEEQQVHEEKREQAEEELDASFEEDMLNELSEDTTSAE